MIQGAINSKNKKYLRTTLSRRGKRHCAGSQCLDPYYDKMALPQHEGKPIQVQAIKGNIILVFLDCEIMWEWEWFSWFKMWNQMIVQVHTSFELRDVINIDDEKFTITFSEYFLFHLNHMKFIVVYRWRHVFFWVFFSAVININDEKLTITFSEYFLFNMEHNKLHVWSF